MPRVPTYDGPQLQTQALRTPTSRPLDVSSGTRAIGQGLADLGEGIDRYEETKAQGEAFDAEQKATAAWLEWDAKARQTYRGENVEGYAPAAEEWWKKAKEEYGSALSPRAKLLIGKSLGQKHLTAKAGVLQFTAGERERHADQAALADLETTIQFGVNSGNLASAQQQVLEKVATMGARKGWTTEEVQAASSEYVSRMHVAQIDNLSAEEGLAYLHANRDQIAFEKAGQLEKYLERNIEVERKQREADAEKAKREAEEKLVDSAWSLYAAGKPIPPSVLAAMPGREAAQLQNAVESKAEREAKGEPIRTNPAEYNRVLADIAEGRPVQLREYSERFAPEDMDRLTKLQREVSEPEKVPEVATLSQQLKSFTAGFSEEKTKWFTDSVQTEISRRQQKEKRALTFEERRDVMEAQYMEGEVLSGNAYTPDFDKRYYELTPEERARWVPEISDSDRALVVQALQGIGIAEPSEAQIIERFKRVKGLQ